MKGASGLMPPTWIWAILGIFRIFQFFGFFDFWDPAPVLGVLDIELLIPEVWDFYLFSGATFFFLS